MTSIPRGLLRLTGPVAVALILAVAGFAGTASAQIAPRGGSLAAGPALLFSPTSLVLLNTGNSGTASIMMENVPAGTLGVQVFIRHDTALTITNFTCRGEFEGGLSVAVPALGGTILACVTYTPVASTSGPLLDLTITRNAPGSHRLTFDISGLNTVFAGSTTATVPTRVNTLTVFGCGRC